MNTEPTDGAENRRYLIAYVLPFAIFMAMTAVEGRPELQQHYPIVYTAKIVLVSLALAWGWKRWPAFENRGLLLGVLFGAVGLVGALFRIGKGGFWSSALTGGLLTVLGVVFLRNVGAAVVTLTRSRIRLPNVRSAVARAATGSWRMT